MDLVLNCKCFQCCLTPFNTPVVYVTVRGLNKHHNVFKVHVLYLPSMPHYVIRLLIHSFPAIKALKTPKEVNHSLSLIDQQQMDTNQLPSSSSDQNTITSSSDVPMETSTTTNAAANGPTDTTDQPNASQVRHPSLTSLVDTTRSVSPLAGLSGPGSVPANLAKPELTADESTSVGPSSVPPPSSFGTSIHNSLFSSNTVQSSSFDAVTSSLSQPLGQSASNTSSGRNNISMAMSGMVSAQVVSSGSTVEGVGVGQPLKSESVTPAGSSSINPIHILSPVTNTASPFSTLSTVSNLTTSSVSSSLPGQQQSQISQPTAQSGVAPGSAMVRTSINTSMFSGQPQNAAASLSSSFGTTGPKFTGPTTQIGTSLASNTAAANSATTGVVSSNSQGMMSAGSTVTDQQQQYPLGSSANLAPNSTSQTRPSANLEAARHAAEMAKRAAEAQRGLLAPGLGGMQRGPQTNLPASQQQQPPPVVSVAGQQPQSQVGGTVQPTTAAGVGIGIGNTLQQQQTAGISQQQTVGQQQNTTGIGQHGAGIGMGQQQGPGGIGMGPASVPNQPLGVGIQQQSLNKPQSSLGSMEMSSMGSGLSTNVTISATVSVANSQGTGVGPSGGYSQVSMHACNVIILYDAAQH